MINVTTSQILHETAEGIALIELASETFRTGKALTSGVEERAEQFLDPEKNKMFQVFESLRAHGFDDRCGPHCSADDIFHAFAFVKALYPLVDFFGIGSSYACALTLDAAFARDKLNELKPKPAPVINCPARVVDYNVFLSGGYADGLTISELSVLSGLEEQSVRNSLHSDKSIPRAIGDQSKQLEVPLKEALEWLRNNGNFREYEPPKNMGDISVPLAKDGSFFNAQCKRSKGFAVGKKGEEIYYKTFHEALDALGSTRIAYWRRPSEATGVAGIVKGVKWVSKSRDELGLD
jgi:hypothetical protein